MTDPFISIVIPAKNAQATIAKCLNSLTVQDYPNYEIIVVDDGSGDDTLGILTSYSWIKVIRTEGVGPSKARNLGVEQSRGEFIAFTDADCIADIHWLSELLKPFNDNTVAGSGGTQKSPADDSSFGKAVNQFLGSCGFISDYLKSGLTMRQTYHNPTCNVMYRKAILAQLGGFLEGLWPGEDVEIDYRIKKKGYRLIFNPAAVVFHYRPGNYRDFNKMMLRYGKAQGWLVKRYGFFRKTQFIPLLMLIFLIFGFFHPWITIWGGAVILAAAFLALAIKSKNAVTMCVLLITALFYWNLGFLRGLFKERVI